MDECFGEAIFIFRCGRETIQFRLEDAIKYPAIRRTFGETDFFQIVTG